MRLVLAFALVLGACGSPPVDQRFVTPEATVTTLLGAYDLADVSQDEIRTRLAARDHFPLRDRDTYEACFTDMAADPSAEGLAGFVVGALAASKDELTVTIEGERAIVSPREGVEIVMRRQDGEYRIVLARSVPDEVRTRIVAVAAHAETRLGRGLATDER